ncbi:MAG TPA: phage tail protein [Anaerolineae bacterium]|nr:phage tail protein [Anaerolineae bacterium]
MGMAARSRPLVGKYAFQVRDLHDGIKQAKFQKCTGIGVTLNIGEYSEGGAQAPMKEVTRVSYSNAMLEHGVFENHEISDWVEDCINELTSSPDGTGALRSPLQLRDFSVDQLRRDRSILHTNILRNCQPASWKPGEHDNTSNDVQVEELEIAYEYFYKKMA